MGGGGEREIQIWNIPFLYGEGQGGKSPFSLLSEPISPSSLLFWANISLLPKRLRFFFSLLPTFFGPFLPPPYSVPPPSVGTKQGGPTDRVTVEGLVVPLHSKSINECSNTDRPEDKTSNTVVFWPGIGRVAQNRHSVLFLPWMVHYKQSSFPTVLI